MLHCETGGSLCFLVFLFIGLSVSDAVEGPLYKLEGSAHKLTFLFLLRSTQLYCSSGFSAGLIWLSDSVCLSLQGRSPGPTAVFPSLTASVLTYSRIHCLQVLYVTDHVSWKMVDFCSFDEQDLIVGYYTVILKSFIFIYVYTYVCVGWVHLWVKVPAEFRKGVGRPGAGVAVVVDAGNWTRSSGRTASTLTAKCFSSPVRILFLFSLCMAHIMKGHGLWNVFWNI